MKWFIQNGSKLERTSLAESDHICQCCQGYNHGATDYERIDVECKQCGQLCCCSCHVKPNQAAGEATAEG